MNGIWALIAALLAFAITGFLGKFLIPYLHKLKYGQTILSIGPSWHKDKQGTPTMGGIMFIIGICVSIIICVFSYYSMSKGGGVKLKETPLMITKILAGLVMALFYGAVGFFDDYIKVVKKRNLGLTARQKLVLQFSIAAVYLITVYISQVTHAGAKPTSTIIPFLGSVDLGILYWPIAAIVIVGVVNAVNLTDGIDGLGSSVTFFVAIFSMIVSGFLGMFGISIAAAALAGGCLGFLIWNFHPAKVFMGDTGSLFLGGMVCALAFGINMPVLIIPLGIVYICEMFSVVMQVIYFKVTRGKRLFKMSPIHHHFEMCGWTESKICFVFSLAAAFGGIISVLMAIFGV